MGAAVSGDTTSDTAVHTNLDKIESRSHLCSAGRTSGLTFHIEHGGAGGCAVVIFGLTVVDSGILREDLNQQQCVLIAVVQELALEAR